MPDLIATARRLALRVIAGPAPPAPVHPGSPAALTGDAAVRRVEGWIVGSDHGPLLEGVAGLSEALGRAGAGLRAAAFLTPAELAAARPLLAAAARRRLPLVAHATGGAEVEALGSGVVVLAAANAQEGVDLALVARRLAEGALAPVVVVMDPVTAASVEEVLLPELHLLRELLGEPGEEIPSPTPAQQSLFGPRRRRVPRWHDAERPLRLGALRGAETEAPAAAAAGLFFDSHLPEILDQALAAFARASGRRLATLSVHGMKGAELVLLARGAAVESAEAVADHLRHEHRLKVGVAGARLLAPFPRTAAVSALRGCRRVVVLEPAGSGEGGLAPALRTALEASCTQGEAPRVAVLHGAAGGALPARDLVAWVRQEATGGDTPPWLGIAGDGVGVARPKLQAARDALIRHYPALGELALPGAPALAEMRPSGAVTLALPGSRGLAGLGAEAAGLLHRLAGGHLRGSLASSFGAAGGPLELVTWAPVPMRHPGADVPAEVGLLVLRPGSGSLGPRERALRARLAPGATLLLALSGDRQEEASSLPLSWLAASAESSLELARVSLPTGEEEALGRERLLGALTAVLVARGTVETNLRKLLAARRSLLPELEEEARQARLDALAAGFQGVVREGIATSRSPAQAPDAARDPEAPLAARRLAAGAAGGAEGHLGDLPHFWDQVGSLYRQGRGEGLAPMPALGAAAEPAGASTLRDSASERTFLPAFDPALCTGCGVCWSACPDGAVGAWVVSGPALVEHAMAAARSAGRPADALRMVAGKLASALTQELSAGGTLAGPLLASAADAVLARSPLPQERKAAVREAADAAAEVLAELPLAATAPFFAEPAAAGEPGEALVIALDPEACKGCGLCVAECAPEALTVAAEAPERTAAARRLYQSAAALPPPTSAALERARSHSEVGALAAALLCPQARGVLVGGDGAEAGSGARLAVRQVLGVAAEVLRPRRQALLEELGELRQRLTGAIREQLGGTLPDRDLAALAAGLGAVERPEVDLAELASRIEAPHEAPRVEVPALRRLVAAAREVTELEARIAGGEGRGPRAPFSLVVATGRDPGRGAAAWATLFPANPFTVPVTVAPAGDPVALARGIARGVAVAAVAEARSLRQAVLTLERPGEAPHSREALAGLSWGDLTAEERRLAPPALLLADEAHLAPFLGPLLELLGEELPVAVLLLTTAGEAEGEGTLRSTSLDLAALARAAGPAPVAEASPAAPGELAAAVEHAITSPGPALLRLHAPSPEGQGFAPAETLARAREEVASGLFVPSLRRGAVEPGDAEDAADSPEALAASRQDEALAELAARHDQELTALRASLEGEADQREARLRLALAQRVRGRLLALTRRPPPTDGREEQP